jgi:hypothetical protein
MGGRGVKDLRGECDVTFSCLRKSCHVPRPKVMAPGAKRKSFDHALASFPAPARGNESD